MKKYLAYYLMLFGIVFISLPAFAQGRAAQAIKSGVSAATGTVAVRTSANLAPTVSRVGSMTKPLGISPVSSASRVVNPANASLTAPAYRVSAVKMEAILSQPAARYEESRFQTLPSQTNKNTWNGAHTYYREYRPRDPAQMRELSQQLAQEAQQRAAKVQEAVSENAAAKPTVVVPSDVAYFHQLTKEGVEPVLHGDIYESAYVRDLLRARETVNGKAPKTRSRSSLENKRIREQDQPTTLLSPQARREFEATVSISRQMAQHPQEFPRRQTDFRRADAVTSGEWDSTRIPSPLELMAPPKDPLAEAKTYEIFDEKNFLDYAPYEQAFHPQVRDLQVLVASDELGFVDHLKRGLVDYPQVHMTAVSSGNEAMALLKQHPEKYHVVLTDIHMHNGTGMDIAKQVQMDNLPCYVVAMSKASANPGRLFLMGFDGSMAVARSQELRMDATKQFLEQNPGTVLDAAGLAQAQAYLLEQNPYQPTKKVFSYLSNLVANGGHIYPVK